MAFPARLRAEMGLIYAPPPNGGGGGGGREGFRAGAAILGGSEETRFINLDGLAQRARRSAGCVPLCMYHSNGEERRHL